MTITENREALRDVQAELNTERARGRSMARDPGVTIAALKDQTDRVDLLSARASVLQQDIESQERQESRAVAGNPKTAQPSLFKSMGEFLSAVHGACMPGGHRDSRLIGGGIRNAATGANEAADADGGFLVPPEYASGVLDFVKTESVLYPQARKVTIESNRLIDIYLNEQSRKDPSAGSRHGGVLAYWKNEADQYSDAKAAFTERETALGKLTAYCPVTEELLQDHPAIEGYLNDLVAREFAFQIDNAILNGSGTGQPLGILNAGNAALVTVAAEASQPAGSIVFENVANMYNTLIAQQRAGAQWYINQDMELALWSMILPDKSLASLVAGSFNAPIYTPPGAFGNAGALLMGKPVTPLEHCEAAGTKGDILLADMSQYLIIERAGVTRQSSMHIRFDFDETVFKFTWRVGGRPDWMNAIEAYRGTSKRSPYVTLAAR